MLVQLNSPCNAWTSRRAKKRGQDAGLENAAAKTAYGVSFSGDEEQMVAHLFTLYAALTM
jgi:hypothetical protein